MSPYRIAVCPAPEGALLFDYAAEAMRKERVRRRGRVAVGALLAVVLFLHAWTSGFDAGIRQWLPLLSALASAASVVAVTWTLLDLPDREPFVGAGE